MTLFRMAFFRSTSTIAMPTYFGDPSNNGWWGRGFFDRQILRANDWPKRTLGEALADGKELIARYIASVMSDPSTGKIDVVEVDNTPILVMTARYDRQWLYELGAWPLAVSSCETEANRASILVNRARAIRAIEGYPLTTVQTRSDNGGRYLFDPFSIPSTSTRPYWRRN